MFPIPVNAQADMNIMISRLPRSAAAGGGHQARSHAVALLAYQFDSRRAHLEEGEAGVDGEHSDRARLMLLQALWERDPFFVHRTFLLFQSAR